MKSRLEGSQTSNVSPTRKTPPGRTVAGAICDQTHGILTAAKTFIEGNVKGYRYAPAHPAFGIALNACMTAPRGESPPAPPAASTSNGNSGGMSGDKGAVAIKATRREADALGSAGGVHHRLICGARQALPIDFQGFSATLGDEAVNN
ncbi:hypothetical protein [Mesorhizobium sp. WSM2239]|uniref:Uncharacterized protein n=2 Tax=unclassified Mesorhizobium TaxID=325217 RepID=A0AAU8DHA9_9HYPH